MPSHSNELSTKTNLSHSPRCLRPPFPLFPGLLDDQKHAQARKPDFDAFIAPQRSEADVVIQVLPTQLIPDDTEGKILRTRMVQKEGHEFFDPAFLFDEGSTISWVPCGRKLTCSFPGIKFAYGPDTYYDNEVSVIEMDGQFDNLQVFVFGDGL